MEYYHCQCKEPQWKNCEDGCPACYYCTKCGKSGGCSNVSNVSFDLKGVQQLDNVITIVEINKLNKIRSYIEDWISKQDHDKCWYYPEIFKQICEVLEIPYEKQKLNSITKEEMKRGCDKFIDEEIE